MKIFNDDATNYDSWYESDEGKFVLTEENNLLEEILKNVDVDFALDAGCGTGEHTRILSKHAKSIIGIDISENMLQEAKKKSIQNTSFIEGNILDSHFADNQFDLIISLAMFEFIDDKDKLMDELYRILKPQGLLVIGTIQKGSSYYNLYMSDFFQQNTVFKYATFISKEELSKYFAKDLVECKECLYKPYGAEAETSNIGSFMIAKWKKGNDNDE